MFFFTVFFTVFTEKNVNVKIKYNNTPSSTPEETWRHHTNYPVLGSSPLQERRND